MKLESIKSFTLTILVGISLLLTVGLWSYQQDNEVLNGQDLQNKIDIGGVELTKQELIEPSTMIFHMGNQHFGFADPSDQHNLFKEIQSWALYNFQLTQKTENITDDERVEIVFPDAIPMQITPVLLTFNQVDKVDLPVWSFKRIIITFNQRNSILTAHFISESGQQRAIATINNSSKYDLLWNRMVGKKGLTELIAFGQGAKPIYIRKNDITMVKRRWTVSTIEPSKLVRVLFEEPDDVSRSADGDYGDVIYSDSIQGMRVQDEGSKIKYFNPLNPTYDQIKAADLLQYSISNINDHKGWTHNYRFVMIDPQINMIRFRMFYKGYPAFSDTDLTIIQQQWRNNDLFKYNRPLISLKNELGNGDKVTLSSGSDIIRYLKTVYADSRDLGQIQDIKIGYQYKYDHTSNFITLSPAWFVKLNDHWQRFEDLLPEKGGEQDAMESD